MGEESEHQKYIQEYKNINIIYFRSFNRRGKHRNRILKIHSRI